VDPEWLRAAGVFGVADRFPGFDHGAFVGGGDGVAFDGDFVGAGGDGELYGAGGPFGGGEARGPVVGDDDAAVDGGAGGDDAGLVAFAGVGGVDRDNA